MIMLFKRLAVFDSDTRWNFGRFAITAATGPVSALLIASIFDAETQGYYYTFNSLLALQIFLELGFTVCVTQFASHEFGRLHLDTGDRLHGDPVALQRLCAIGSLTFKWFFVGGVLLFLALGAAGEFFFRGAPGRIDWRTPWWMLCLGSSLGFIGLAPLAMLNGCNQVGWTAKISVIQNLVRAFLLIALILGGTQLYAPAISQLVANGMTLLAVLWLRRSFFFNFRNTGSDRAVSWITEILPMQWRLAVSWISGYLVFSTFVPVLFKSAGPMVAGQFGLTWAIIQTISALAQVPVSAKLAVWGMLLARKDLLELRKRWVLAWHQSIAIATVGAVAFALLLLGIDQYDGQLRARFVGWSVLLPLLAAMMANQFVFAAAALARAERHEPFLWPSVVSAILLFTGNLVLAPKYGAEAVAIYYLLITLVFLPVARRILYQTQGFTTPILC